jgi:hypothetical protein
MVASCFSMKRGGKIIFDSPVDEIVKTRFKRVE